MEEDGTALISESVWLQRQCLGCEMTQPFNKHIWAHYHFQKGNSEQKDMLQNSILRKKNNNPKTDLICNNEMKTIYTLQYHEVLRWEHTRRAKPKRLSVFMDSVLTLTSVSEVGGKVLGSRVSALQLQVAPGEQAPLDRPEQGGEHRAHLPLSSINHQQLTLHKRRQMESVYKVTCRTQPGRSLREQLSEVKRFRQVGDSYERAFNPKVTEKDGSMKTPLLPSGFSEPLQMVSTLWAIPCCPLGALHPSYLPFSLSLSLCFSVCLSSSLSSSKTPFFSGSFLWAFNQISGILDGHGHIAIFKTDNQQGPTIYSTWNFAHVMWQPGWEGSLGENGHVHMYGWVLLLFVWNYSQVVLVVKNPPANAGHVWDMGLISGSGRSPGGENGNPLQYCCLENPMDRGAWWATDRMVTKSRTWLQWLSTRETITTLSTGYTPLQTKTKHPFYKTILYPPMAL